MQHKISENTQKIQINRELLQIDELKLCSVLLKCTLKWFSQKTIAQQHAALYLTSVFVLVRVADVIIG